LSIANGSDLFFRVQLWQSLAFNQLCQRQMPTRSNPIYVNLHNKKGGFSATPFKCAPRLRYIPNPTNTGFPHVRKTFYAVMAGMSTKKLTLIFAFLGMGILAAKFQRG